MMRKLGVLVAGVLAGIACWAGDELRAGFLSPPDSAKPWCYWWWSNGNVDKETITADLEAMKRLGFGALLMVDSRGYWDKDEDHVPNPPVKLVWGSEAWYDHVEFAIRECARIGLEFTMNAAASGGTLNGFKDGKAYEVDIMDRDAVVAHLDRAIGPLLKRVGNLVGTTFTHIYSVSYEGNVRKDASWRQIKDTFYATMRQWAHDHGLKVFSESGGPWGWGAAEKAFAGADQLQMLEFNDFPQGEYWVVNGWGLTPQAGHANANGRFFTRGIVLAARQHGSRIASAEAFTHMLHHYSVDPALLKPLADQAFADGVNRLVWHTFSCSPKEFGIPGVEYFAGSHVNRNVTWHEDAAAFVKYLGRCQYLLQQGDYIDDGEFDGTRRAYYGWGRGRRNPSAQFTWTHRKTADADIFFVAGEGKGEVTLNAVAPSVELWDAVTGTIAPAKAEKVCEGKTKVSLDLPVGGSTFVVFWKGGRVEEWKGGKVEEKVGGPWKVDFAYHPGVTAEPPASVEMKELVDFTTRDDLRYFAGTATYKTSFVGGRMPKAGEEVVLTLGTVPSGLAHVFVNGKDCGTVWCAPWEADVTAAVREGQNELEIRYVNNWHNRLVGDCLLPPEQRVTRSNLRYWTKPRKGDWKNNWSLRPTVYSGPSVNDPLQRSGLLGPVSVRFGRQVVSENQEGAKPMTISGGDKPVVDRFMNYVTFDTQSSAKGKTLPSTPGQTVFARHLAEELKTLGAKDVFLSDGAYVYATVPASSGREGEPALGFLSHLDTAPDAPGKDVKPRRVVYGGGVLPLGTSGRTLDPAVFPELKRLVGKELVVTDGTTLLGADDKLGIAILMTLAETLLKPDAPSHREIRLCFTPDEELGAGLRGFDPARFGAKVAFTVDGSSPSVIVNANFNAARATLNFRGVSVHPGGAKGAMVNALKLAAAFVGGLPPQESPECTSGREGFYHPTSISGSIADAKLSLLIRDHDAKRFEERKRFLERQAEAVNAKYGKGTVTLAIEDQYRNMEEGLVKVPGLVEAAKKAVRSVGLEPYLSAARGGTDGAALTQMGIPCPDLGTGGRNFHGECEYAIVEEAEKALRIVLWLAKNKE